MPGIRHRWNPKVVFFFSLIGVLGQLGLGCANTPKAEVGQEQLEERRLLEKAFLRWRQALQSNDWETVLSFLSVDSKRWLVDISQSARRDDARALADKSFEDVVFSLALRVDRRKTPGLDDRPLALLARLFESGSPIRRAFLNAELGRFQIQTGTATLALRDAPLKPVFHFIKEGEDWRLEWRQTLPLLMRDAEALSRPHGKNKVEQAIWLLRDWGDREVYPEDLSEGRP
jgi:hypothetical protein